MLKIVCVSLLLFGVVYGKPPYKPVNNSLTDDDIHFRINGGVDADPDEFPFMAMLTNTFGYLFCGGALISDYYVLTAAHCLHKRVAQDIVVRLGDYNWSTDEEQFHVDIPAESFVVHPKFKYDVTFHDIALIRLSKPAPDTPHISPICLPPLVNFDGEKATISGWGSTTAEGFPVPSLMKLDLKILSERECLDMLRGLRIYYIPEKICGYAKLKDSCKGDSGGPLVWEDKSDQPLVKKRHLIGVVSLGFQCGITGQPGLYTRVTSYLPWIKENAKDDKTICWAN